MADPGTGRVMHPTTPFLIASVTKMYTAAATMILAERGHLALEDKISKHLPSELVVGLHHYEGRDYSNVLTIRHLLGQTSGLPDYSLEKPKQGKSVFEQILEEGDRAYHRTSGGWSSVVQRGADRADVLQKMGQLPLMKNCRSRYPTVKC